MKKWLYLTFAFIFLVVFPETSGFAATVKTNPAILVLNSYHIGYLWSDGEVNGIENALFKTFPEAEITVEYLDTKRIPPEKSFARLFALFQDKYEKQRFDLIISVDDNALNFLKRYRSRLFGDTPVVFCGVNDFRPEKIRGMRHITGVSEIHRIEDNLKLLWNLHPGLKKVVVVTDMTSSGQISLQEVKSATPAFADRLDFTYLEGLPLPRLKKHLASLDKDSVVFLLNYFRDDQGNYYSPEAVMSVISRASPVPVYCFSEFYINHGATGGLINEGFVHGGLAGRVAVSLLMGKDINRMSVVEGPMRPVFDFRQVLRFNLDATRLPADAQLWNQKHRGQKEILVLHSCHTECLRTAQVTAGIKKGLDELPDRSGLFVEYMDSYRYSGTAYSYQLYELYKTKYAHRNLELVMVSGDNALRFVRKFKNLLFGRKTPIVFCEVSSIEDQATVSKEGITGVMQSHDIRGTVNTIMGIYPQTRKLLVITDQSPAGRQRKKLFAQTLAHMDSSLKPEFTDEMTMEEILTRVASLDDDTAVLYSFFIRDARNARFKQEESVHLICQACNQPVFGFNGNFLKYGLTGGSITDGYSQGLLAARLATRIWQGTEASQIPIMEEAPHHFMFDYNALQDFNISTEDLPEGSTLVNEPDGFYSRYKRQVDFVILFFLMLFILIVIQHLHIRRSEKRKKEIESEARIDGLTGTILRKYFAQEMDTLISTHLAEHKKMVFCFGDINNLKYVNDTFGHSEGDNYITTVVNTIRSTVRASDHIYRMGGDEFIIVFTDCGEAQARNRIDNILKKLEKLNREPGNTYRKGISFGHTEFDPAKPQSMEQILETTDSRMYERKGRSSKKEGPSPPP